MEIKTERVNLKLDKYELESLQHELFTLGLWEESMLGKIKLDEGEKVEKVYPCLCELLKLLQKKKEW